MDFNGQATYNNRDRVDDLVPDRSEMKGEELFAQTGRLLNDGVIKESVDRCRRKPEILNPSGSF